MRVLIIQIVFLLFPLFVAAQPAPKNISGRVLEGLDHAHTHSLVGANIYWAGTTLGTVSDTNGYFTIDLSAESNLLVISFAGFNADTVEVINNDFIEVTLFQNLEIEQVEIVKRWKTTTITLLDPMKAEILGEKELMKAACCNLSESFETNASVDVSFTDAITGTKQIQMLGLAGPYSQITRENMPDIRGLSAIYGMEYIPGTWIESIQLNKGTGSVVNGFESIAGQINVELRKPETADRVFLNVYGNEDSRIEANLNLAQKVSENLSTGILIHARTQRTEMDRNTDGFMDKPVGDQYILLNRWNLSDYHGWVSQIGLKATFNSVKGGQMGFSETRNKDLWGMEMETRRLESWLKIGKVFENNPTQSIGMQFSGVNHDQQSVFGLRDYTGLQNSGYANIIFQSQPSVYHTYKVGASFQYDYFREHLDSLRFNREEFVPGAFIEYAFSPNDNVDIVAGLRGDYHNNYGFFATPRLHVRYAPAERSVFRLSVGRGQRTASILAENNTVMASSRNIIVLQQNNGNPYGLNEEIAWNFGANFTQKFTMDYREGVITADLYHTRFVNQVVVDRDENPQQVLFYNLDGESFSTSFQVQFDYEVLRRLDARLAYRWYHVQTNYISGILDKPMVSPHRAFMNLAYSTRNHWMFDYTVQWQSAKRIPSTASNPETYRINETSPDFFLMNAQITKQWREKFDVYVGVENILDFRQENPIIAADDPFGPYFDASLTWGPIFGRMVYAGIRLRIK
jgi:outer membrane receptor for ferrienterochelin and colicins